MQIEELRVGEVTILTVTGDFDARTLPVAAGRLDALLADLKIRIVFNLSSLEIVTSTAIGFLVDASKRARGLGGGLVVSAPSRLFRSTVDTLRIGEVLVMAPSDEEAVEQLQLREEAPESETESNVPRGWRRFFGRRRR